MTHKKYSPYDLENYAVVQDLHHWHHYLIGKEFVLYSDHEALEHLNSQKKMSANRVKWSAYLQEFMFVLRHKLGTKNKVADALNLRSHLLTTIFIIVTGFEEIRREYPDDHEFDRIYKALLNGECSDHPKFSIHDGYLFYGNQLCLLATLMLALGLGLA